MTLTVRFVLILVAIILWVIAALGIGAGRFSLTNAGLAFFGAAFLVG